MIPPVITPNDFAPANSTPSSMPQAAPARFYCREQSHDTASERLSEHADAAKSRQLPFWSEDVAWRIQSATGDASQLSPRETYGLTLNRFGVQQAVKARWFVQEEKSLRGVMAVSKPPSIRKSLNDFHPQAVNP